jgi:hypothetical protein
MSGARVRLWIAAALFAGWLGWLAYLAATTTHPVVLSRPQFLVSTLDVIAEVHAADGHPAEEVTVREVHWPATGREKLVGEQIRVINLPKCEGWDLPGSYILPLVREGDAYRVASTPPSPGYSPLTGDAPQRIYPVTDETRHQLETIRKPE